MGLGFYNALGIFRPNTKMLSRKLYLLKIKEKCNQFKLCLEVVTTSKGLNEQLGSIYSTSQKSSGFLIVVHLNNALSVVILFPFFRTRHKCSFYDRTVSTESLHLIHFCLNGRTAPALWSDDMFKSLRRLLAYYSEV